MKEYYDARAAEYDEWYTGGGLFAARDRPGWHDAVRALEHFTGHFYGHLEDRAREAFLAQARRLASELVVVDSAVRPDHDREEWQTRVLNDGSRHQVYKRYFDADELAAELGGGTVLHSGDWFVMVATGDELARSR